MTLTSLAIAIFSLASLSSTEAVDSMNFSLGDQISHANKSWQIQRSERRSPTISTPKKVRSIYL